MNQSNVHLLNLPDEILLIILKKLNNIDVLYSLLDIDNQRLNLLAQEEIFSNTLNFVPIDNISSIDHHKLDRFCLDILPRIHHNVRCFILEPVLMERILLAAHYPNLTKLKLFNFDQKICLSFFTNESSLRYIFQEQITDLILGNSDSIYMERLSKNYTRNVYGHILNFFKNLKHLSLIETFNPSYRRLSIRHFPSNIFFSSTLTYLCINMNTLDDCLYLLDGRLKHLSTFIVEITFVDEYSSIVHNMDDLPNLKYFSLKSYFQIRQYDNKILPLLRRMSFLEKLTLYLRIKNQSTFINSTHLENEILVYMPRLHSFNFYIATYDHSVDLFHYVPTQSNQQIFTNIRQQPMASIINYISDEQAVCHIFSLPFVFDRFEDIGNIFSDTIFNYVTCLLVQDIFPFNHEFFIRVARSFPLLKNFRIVNFQSQLACNLNTSADGIQAYSTVEYPHLTSLDLGTATIDYAEQFLNETKTYLPYLAELTISYHKLRMVTNNFTREETRRNCMKVKRLNMIGTFVHLKNFYLYLPLL